MARRSLVMPMTGWMRRVKVGLADVVLCRGKGGAVTAFHNSCRFRGFEPCRADVEALACRGCRRAVPVPPASAMA